MLEHQLRDIFRHHPCIPTFIPPGNVRGVDCISDGTQKKHDVTGSEVMWQATGPWMLNASGAETGAMSPCKALDSFLGLHRTLKQQFM